ncbi:uncharacterized protein LOC115454477 [Manduca sexta]|uniref:uncharacterized protein LOC115454477 n=1 Tax=Manduca sexta TaxID=7130 RepID=UPI00188F8DAB|nr:uncharacterized protein LOC115454477 [Manduca sexta]
MGKDKKRKRDMINELSERLMELEKRMRRRHSGAPPGEEGTPSANNAISIHDGLSRRWTTIIQNGLKEDTKIQIIKKYDTPKNLPLLIPPKLNEEVVAAMNDSGIKRDRRIAEQQVVLGAAVTCIAKVLNNIICLDNKENIEILSDSGRLLCDLYYNNCMTRRSLILPGLNKEMKELMEKTPISEYLFGDKLQEKVNAVKAVKKSGQELKNTPTQAKPPMKPNQKNYRGPQRLQAARPSGPKQTKKIRHVAKPTVRAKRSPPRHYHSRRQNRR